MEALLQNIERKKKPILQEDEFSPSDVAAALAKFVEALRRLQQQGQLATSSSSGGQSSVTVDWLLAICTTVHSDLGPERLAQAVLDASHLQGDDQQQAALFDALGASDEAMQVMFDIASRLGEIRKIKKLDLASDEQKTAEMVSGFSDVVIDPEEHRRQQLRQEALGAAQIAAITKAEAESLAPSASSGVTHTVTRASGVQAHKDAQKAAKRAAQALKKARDAGAIVDESELMVIEENQTGGGGLMGMSQEQVWEMQQSLLPEGSRQYYDEQGLPSGTTREHEGNLERVVIPPAHRDESSLHPRLKVREIMDSTEAVAFEGTKSLNPMQSTTYDVAFKTRLNMLVCAPTGAGKTNVAMLTIVQHLRHVGLIGNNNTEETGKKIVYIAPMKALAQEIVEKFSSKLKPLGLIVKELTGDMQLTRAAAEAANILVTTPEKWDVVTRKSGTDENSLGNKCGLLIIDEVHLLADERGAVIESVVSRFHRLVESRQRQVRIVALSATLPNYADVAEFLQVPQRGLFFFGPEHRPVPLQQQFIGVVTKTKDRFMKEQKLNDVCYEEALDSLKRGHQVMVFVHSRKGTGDTATALADRASNESLLEKYFITQGKEGALGAANKRFSDRVKKSRNRELGLHFDHGMGIHHAGMLRGDRKLTEQMFADGAIRVLCCTATLAWGVNLPVHSVIIKGTEVYNPEKGGIVDLSILDVQQIFGRAGRPQFDSSGEATLITVHDALQRYLDKLIRAVPIESNFIKQLADHLNAEVVGGTVSTVREAATWLKYTYLYVRMLKNPLAYGINADQFADDPQLNNRCLELVKDAAKFLDYNRMIRYGEDSGNLSFTTRGRVAAHFYINAESVSIFNEMLEGHTAPSDSHLARVVCSADEFKNMKMRQEEFGELETLAKTTCPLDMKKPHADGENMSLVNDEVDKAFVLLQAYISRHRIKSFTLVTDMNYLASNAARVARAIFEMSILEGMATEALKLLRIAKSVDNQIWWFQTPLRHFEGELKNEVFLALETQKSGYDSFESTLSLLDMSAKEAGQLCRCYKGGAKIQSLVKMIPKLDVHCMVQPVTSSVFRFHIELHPNFVWSPRWHGGAQSFWLWVEDGDNNKVYHSEHIVFSKRTYPDPLTLDLNIPAFEPLPNQYYIRIVSDTWVAVEILHPISLRNIKMPEQKTPFTDLIDLTPLPTIALQEPKYEQLYSKFEHFNPIQTQLFHVLYHTDSPVFLGAPTGSGKTAVSEIAMLRMKRLHPKGVCVYIAPLKSLARERLKEWRVKFGSAPLNWSILELSGDTHHGKRALEQADILVCTPEKYDLISRGWRGDVESDVSDAKTFLKRVRLLVIDEVHLLGEDRGAVLEAIVSRTRFISMQQKASLSQQEASETGKDTVSEEMTRIIGLSTALANPLDLADWMGVNTTGHGSIACRGLYNFRASVRPVSMKVHVQGFSGQHYCPRMATMNKPCYAAIKDHAPDKPTLIFVASRRQTRLTAFDIISYAAGDENPKMFLCCSEDYIESIAERIHDEALRHTITFGIGLHHAGLASSDRDIVERLFLNGDIMVLVATATLAWGVNLPAHLVIVKGTEYFDGKQSRYVDYPLTDVLQMIGRAGRPGFSDEGRAVVMAQESKKNFYLKFLYIPFPVESCLRDRLSENLNAEIAIRTVNSVIDAVGYMTWTFYARRVKANPSYYGAESGDNESVEQFLFSVVKESVDTLKEHGCISAEGDGDDATLSPTVLGLAACKYYLLCTTPKQMQFGVREARKMVQNIIDTEKVPATTNKPNKMIPFGRSSRVDEVSMAWLLYTLASTHEFDELPVRHNEEMLNEELSDDLMWGPDTQSLLTGNRDQYYNPEIYEDPHTKCFLLLQAHLERAKLPISDYINDTKSVTDNVPRLLAAMQFIALGDRTSSGSMELICQFARTKQYLSTMSLVNDDPLVQLPGISNETAKRLVQNKSANVKSVRELRALDRKTAAAALQKVLRGKNSVDNALDHLFSIPAFSVAEAKVQHELEKKTGESRGKLKLSLEFNRQEPTRKKRGRRGDDVSYSLVLVLGSFKQRMILADSSVSVSRGKGTWTVSKELDFDWNAANADGGEGQGQIMLRLCWEEIRGFDAEMVIPIK